MTSTNSPPDDPVPGPTTITGVVLCGGQGSRLGGIDKGLIMYRERTLVCHALAALSCVAATRLINANRNLEAYTRLGFPVITDPTQDYPGPLAGILAAFNYATTPFVLTLPCDMPLMDGDALNRLISAWNPGSSEIVTVSDGIRLHPVVALLDTRLKVSLEEYLANNQRKVETWFHNHYLTLADFSDRPDVLANLNTKEDWQQLGQFAPHSSSMSYRGHA